MTSRPRPAPPQSPLRAALGRLISVEPAAEFAAALPYSCLAEMVGALEGWLPPVLPAAELEDLAIAFRNDQVTRQPTGYAPAVPGRVDARTLQRWKINYLRHVHSPYDQAMTAARWLVDAQEVPALQAVIAQAIDARIGAAYPSLAYAARRRTLRRWGLTTQGG